MAVSWDADPGATGYVVKSTQQFVPNPPASVTVTGTSTSITVIPAQAYCVQVPAVNSYGASAWSPASPLCVQAMPGA
ncbi:fibronectin type III domain-containing protein [Catenulispora pinisilvae]|uniref:fibronectin type III domain-containing protein n=1 Tax=Catenulispora pinisilvae TaxID=2705253 RepID=UPI0018916F6E|nr:fibronectin type III domain-containing protein [Catenulispora pinisilvae]